MISKVGVQVHIVFCNSVDVSVPLSFSRLSQRVEELIPTFNILRPVDSCICSGSLENGTSAETPTVSRDVIYIRAPFRKVSSGQS